MTGLLLPLYSMVSCLIKILQGITRNIVRPGEKGDPRQNSHEVLLLFRKLQCSVRLNWAKTKDRYEEDVQNLSLCKRAYYMEFGGVGPKSGR